MSAPVDKGWRAERDVHAPHRTLCGASQYSSPGVKRGSLPCHVCVCTPMLRTTSSVAAAEVPVWRATLHTQMRAPAQARPDGPGVESWGASDRAASLAVVSRGTIERVDDR
eukprot:7381808-Prymnesium_polylepis.2